MWSKHCVLRSCRAPYPPPTKGHSPFVVAKKVVMLENHQKEEYRNRLSWGRPWDCIDFQLGVRQSRGVEPVLASGAALHPA